MASPEVIAAYFGGAALILTSIGNLLISYRNSNKLTEIHTVTNSGLTDTKNELIKQQQNVVRLEKSVTALEAAATLRTDVHNVIKDDAAAVVAAGKKGGVIGG